MPIPADQAAVDIFSGQYALGAPSTPKPLPADQAAADIFSGQYALGARASVAQVVDRNPDKEAQIQRQANQLGVPYDSARANDKLIQQRSAAQAVDYNNLARTAPRTAQFLSSTSNAAVAHDDIGVLGLIEKGLRTFANPASLVTDLFQPMVGRNAQGVANDAQKQGGAMPYLGRVLHTDMGAPIKRGLANLAFGALGVVETAELGEKLDVTAGMQRRLFGGTLESGLVGLSRAARRKLEQGTAYEPADTQLGRDIQMGIESIPLSLGALATTLATGGTAPSLGLIGATTYGQSYGQARDQGVGVGRAAAKSAIDAAVEIGTEYLPEKWFLHDANVGASFGKMLLDQVKAELPGEQVATLLQDFNQWSMIDANQGKSFGDYASEILSHATSTLVATGVGIGSLAGVGAGAHGAVSGINKLAGTGRRPLADEDPGRAAARGEARTAYASVIDDLRAIRRSPAEEAAQLLQALAEDHAQKKPALEELHAHALTDLASAKDAHQQALDAQREAKQNASTSRTKARYAPDLSDGSGQEALGQQQAGQQAKATADEVSRASLAAARAALALQAHALVEQHIQAYANALGRQQKEVEGRALNVARRLAQKEGAAQQAFSAAQQFEDLGKLAEASKLRQGPFTRGISRRVPA